MIAMTAFLYFFLMVCNIAFLLVDIIRDNTVRGTRLRYACATIQWALAPPSFTLPALLILVGHYVSGSISFLTALWALYDLYTSDDDNWWRRKRKQLKRRLTVTWVRLHPAGAKA